MLKFLVLILGSIALATLLFSAMAKQAEINEHTHYDAQTGRMVYTGE